MAKKQVEKKERVIPKMVGSMSKSAKRLFRNFPKSVQRMVQEAEHNAKHLEYMIMSYDVQIDKKTGEGYKAKAGNRSMGTGAA